jgi:cytochrome c peroxidase
MSRPRALSMFLVSAASAASCFNSEPKQEAASTTVASSALTAEDRVAACAQDPRVVTGLASAQICAGAGVFFEETFGGNGRTCGTCHPASNNFTIDVDFINTRPQSDPLFVFENDPTHLGNLEDGSLRAAAGILENVDGFQDPTHKFVIRSVPHLLALSTSIGPDVNDPATTVPGTPPDPAVTVPPLQRTGWAGDGGNLIDFLDSAIKQHYPKTLNRVAGVDFRVATTLEKQLVQTFQLNIGRQNELDLTQVNLSDAQAQEGRRAFLDPMRGRCNVCHTNGGANFIDTGKNRNFDIGTRFAPNNSFTVPFFDGVFLFDGGFGGTQFTDPNIVVLEVTNPNPPKNGFGNNTFNPPPVIEAADTLPAFHTNFFGAPGSATHNIEDVVTFYAGLFNQSPAAADLTARFGAPANVGPDIDNIGRFLRALNVALNIDMAKQRLRASQTILNQFHDQSLTIQQRLITLAVAEIDDALQVLQDPRTPQPFYPVSVDRLGLAKTEIANALAAATFVQRQGPLSNAISRLENARDPIGSNINFTLGAGDLFFEP